MRPAEKFIRFLGKLVIFCFVAGIILYFMQTKTLWLFFALALFPVYYSRLSNSSSSLTRVGKVNFFGFFQKSHLTFLSFILCCKQTSELFEASSENMLDSAIQHPLIINDVEIHQKQVLPVAT